MTELYDFFDEILENRPSRNTLFLILTKMKQVGQVDKVIQKCVEALAFYPDDIRLRSLLTESYYEAGMLDQALSEIKKTSSILDEGVSVYKRQARIYLDQDKPEAAEEALKRFMAHHPDDEDARDMFSQLRSLKEAETEEESPDPLAETERTQENEALVTELATPTLAELYFKQGQIDQAISAYERVLADDPNDYVSSKRLEELKALLGEDKAVGPPRKTDRREKTEKIIAALDDWLTRIKVLSNA
jgi:tetratricopeptide (TPR) repeat protein